MDTTAKLRRFIRATLWHFALSERMLPSRHRGTLGPWPLVHDSQRVDKELPIPSYPCTVNALVHVPTLRMIDELGGGGRYGHNGHNNNRQGHSTAWVVCETAKKDAIREGHCAKKCCGKSANHYGQSNLKSCQLIASKINRKYMQCANKRF